MLKIFTDGSCMINPNGPGGYCFVVAEWEDVVIGENNYFEFGGDLSTTNNRMELMAVLQALKWCEKHQKTNVVIYSDSKYVVNVCTTWANLWAKNDWHNKQGDKVKNLELIKPIYGLYKEVKASAKWVKGHNGDVFNEFCDSIANREALKYLQQRKATYNDCELGSKVCQLIPGSYFADHFEVIAKFHSSGTISVKHLRANGKLSVMSAEEFDNKGYIKI